MGQAVVAQAPLTIVTARASGRAAITALALIATAAHADDRKYTVADLKTLVGERAFQEAFTHLGDIAPTQRTAEWIDVAATAAVGVLQALPTDDASAIAMIDAVDREYPQLLKATKYTKVRAELGVKGIAVCYQRMDTEECVRAATRFVAASDREVTIEVARTTTPHAAAAALAMFKQAFDPKDPKLCKDERLQRAMIAGLWTTEGKPTATDARSLMTSCWDGVKDAIVKTFGEAGKNSDFHKNTCDVLKAKRLLSSLQAKRCK